MPNSFAYADVFQQMLDLQVIQESVTGWMDANAGQVIYDGGKTVKIPKMSINGLADYDRTNGYDRGAATLSYETFTMTQDRGRQFILDAMDVNETNFVANAGAVMGEFQRTMVIPEIDAYRISKLATAAISNNNADYSYTPDKTTIVDAMKDSIARVKKNGFRNTPLVIMANTDSVSALEKAKAQLGDTFTWTQGGLETIVPALDGIPVIEVADERMYSAITLATNNAGGYTKGAAAKDINFVVVAAGVPLAITKQNDMKIFEPAQVQSHDGWLLDYRRYHDLWIMDNKVGGIAINSKDAE